MIKFNNLRDNKVHMLNPATSEELSEDKIGNLRANKLLIGATGRVYKGRPHYWPPLVTRNFKELIIG